jgi:hypothetical protein
LLGLFHPTLRDQSKKKYNFQKGKLKPDMEKEYCKAMYGWAKEHYHGLIDKEIATALGKFRILLFVFNLASFSRPLQCCMGWQYPTQKV